ncbi:hypothetical protein ACFL3D_02935 [Candidatus Omnitrophota bacterium]
MKNFTFFKITSFITFIIFACTTITFASPEQFSCIEFSDTLAVDQKQGSVDLRSAVVRETTDDRVLFDVFFSPSPSLAQDEMPQTAGINVERRPVVKTLLAGIIGARFLTSMIGTGIFAILSQACDILEPPEDILPRIDEASDSELIKWMNHDSWEVQKAAAGEYLLRGVIAKDREAAEEVVLNRLIMPMILSLKGDSTVQQSSPYLHLLDAYVSGQNGGSSFLKHLVYRSVREYLFYTTLPFDKKSRWGCAYLYQEMQGGYGKVRTEMWDYIYPLYGEGGEYSDRIIGYTIVVLIQDDPFEEAMKYVDYPGKENFNIIMINALVHIGNVAAVGKIEYLRVYASRSAVREAADKAVRILMADVDVTTWSNNQLFESLDQWPDQPTFILFQVAQELFERDYQEGIEKAQDILVYPRIGRLQAQNYAGQTAFYGDQLVELGPISLDPLINVLYSGAYVDTRKWCAYLIGQVANEDQFYKAYIALCKKLDSGDYSWVKIETRNGLEWLLRRHAFTIERALTIIGPDADHGSTTAYVKALNVLGEKGTLAEIPAIERLRDTTTNNTVKAAAEAAIAQIRSRYSGSSVSESSNAQVALDDNVSIIEQPHTWVALSSVIVMSGTVRDLLTSTSEVPDITQISMLPGSGTSAINFTLEHAMFISA